MKTKIFLFVVFLIAAAFVANYTYSSNTNNPNLHEKRCSAMDSVKTDDSKCFVTGDELPQSGGIVVKYLGKEYHFCCKDCVNKFKAEPMDYIKDEIKCPVMNEIAERDLYSIYKGMKYYFCCKPCVKHFNENPEKYLEKFDK